MLCVENVMCDVTWKITSKSPLSHIGEIMGVTFISILIAVLLAVTAGFAVEYYRNLIRAKVEYEKAKATLSDIILSFSGELKRITENIETSSARSEKALSKVSVLEGKVDALEDKANAAIENLNKIMVRLEEVERKACDVVASQKELMIKVSQLEEKAMQAAMPQNTGIETVIPIRREKALAHLTRTELTVLEMLATEGPKTTSEIRERIKLSREHVARLMKKLYEEGYVERDSSKIPFKYNVKREVESLLKGTGMETA